MLQEIEVLPAERGQIPGRVVEEAVVVAVALASIFIERFLRRLESVTVLAPACGRWPRLVPRDEEAAKKLAKRTLTNLYNERPAWLAHAHHKLDEAVFAAYGWPVDLTDEQILERLLALNLERAAAEKGAL